MKEGRERATWRLYPHTVEISSWEITEYPSELRTSLFNGSLVCIYFFCHSGSARFKKEKEGHLSVSGFSRKEGGKVRNVTEEMGTTWCFHSRSRSTTLNSVYLLVVVRDWVGKPGGGSYLQMWVPAGGSKASFHQGRSWDPWERSQPWLAFVPPTQKVETENCEFNLLRFSRKGNWKYIFGNRIYILKNIIIGNTIFPIVGKRSGML